MLLQSVNSSARCDATSSASTLTFMGKGRKPLEAWQLQDAVRLKRLWLEKRPLVGGRPMTQEEFADEHLNGTQGLFFQYISGRIPLNLDAALKFSAGLGVPMAEFSPTLAERLRQAAEAQQLIATYSAGNVRDSTARMFKEPARDGRPRVALSRSRKSDKGQR
jgi:hypothetical protein